MKYFMCNFHCLFIDACKGLLGLKGAYNVFVIIFVVLIFCFLLLCVVHFKVKSLNIPQLTDDCHENGMKHKGIN